MSQRLQGEAVGPSTHLSAGPGKQVGVPHPFRADRVRQRPGDVLLPHQLFEALRPIAAGNDYIRAGFRG